MSRSVSRAVSHSDSRAVSSTPLTANVGQQSMAKGSLPNSDTETLAAMFEAFDIEITLSRIHPKFSLSALTIFGFYIRWKSISKAFSIYEKLTNDGRWKFQPMDKVDIINHFMPKSTYYKSVNAQFSAITNNGIYADMKQWLESEGGEPATDVVWGADHPKYTLDHLATWISYGGSLIKPKKSSKVLKKVSHKKK